MTLAPIGMSVYTRIDHFRRSIAALQSNSLADQSRLFVYSDAAQNLQDERLVREVRDFAHGITGFSEVHVIERKINYGGTRNSFLAYSEIIERFGRSIYLEDDIQCAPGFLTFVNEALEFYKDDKRIVSIAGYKPPFSLPRDLVGDVFVLGRVNGWGMGSFERTLEMARSPINRKEFESAEDKTIFTSNGKDVLQMIERELAGVTDAGDVRCMYQQAINKTLTVYPRVPLTRNNGTDGTGVHSGTTTKFEVGRLWEKTGNFEFTENITVDSRIQEANRKFRDDGFYSRIRRKLKSLV